MNYENFYCSQFFFLFLQTWGWCSVPLNLGCFVWAAHSFLLLQLHLTHFIVRALHVVFKSAPARASFFHTLTRCASTILVVQACSLILCLANNAKTDISKVLWSCFEMNSNCHSFALRTYRVDICRNHCDFFCRISHLAKTCLVCVSAWSTQTIISYLQNIWQRHKLASSAHKCSSAGTLLTPYKH